ncbi:MAG: prolipoprotein diacylglyceryl transferase [Gemmatimonadetes bacterium]|nr:prolipoprotein diacylglyceryl transferase [Gemmatimonadota bacterium]
MTPIIHHPAVLHLGPLEITGFGLAVLAAFAISQLICQRELWRRGQDHEAEAIPDLVFAALVGTLIGAKTYYVVLTGDPGAFLSRGGFVFWGGFIGAVLLCAAVIRVKKLNFLRIADVAGIAIAGGYAVGRTGCWAVGDDYGRPWDGFLATQFPQGAPPSTVAVLSQQFGIRFPADLPPTEVVAVHPTQLYETALGFVMFWLLWRLRDHRRLPGWLFGGYCLLAGVERFVVEFFRAKDDRFVAGLTMAQVIALTVAAVGVALLVARGRPASGRPQAA